MPKNKYYRYQRDRSLNERYGLLPEEYDRLFRQQRGLCAVCHQPETRIEKRSGEVSLLAVDHDHETGAVRGLLCYRCNVALGYLQDDPAIVRSLLDYLERHRQEYGYLYGG